MSSKLESKMNRLNGRMQDLEQAMHNVIHRVAILEVVLNHMIEIKPELLEGFEEAQKKLVEEAKAAEEAAKLEEAKE